MDARTSGDDPAPPDEPVKLIFVHHSCGENWLDDSDGGLGIALRDDNYFVSDTNYGWGPDAIGDLTDIGHWWTWFCGPKSSKYMSALYTEYGTHSSYSRMVIDPAGENEIIMFKSCYPNSYLGGHSNDPPTEGANPLRGHDAYDDSVHTVANAKGIYNDILTTFATRQDKLFIVVTAPPQMESQTDAGHAANARALNDWLINDWLEGYDHDNVAVFDFYNVLTSNGGDRNTNDLGEATGNHHRWRDGRVQHVHPVDQHTSAYWGGSGGGSHPTAAGNRKATAEFAPLLNVFYARWRDAGQTPSAWVYLPVILKRWHAPSIAPTPTSTRAAPSCLIEPSDLVYQGAFAFPTGDAWAYSGHALAYYAAGDPDGPVDRYPGSLYAAGSAADDYDLVGEIAIPSPVIADRFDELPRAPVLRPLADITGGWKENCTYAPECDYRNVDGLAYLPNVGKIAWNLRDWYNVAAHDQDSLGWSDLDMTGAQGVWHVGDRPSDDDVFHNAKTCDYLLLAAESFAEEFLDGKRLIAGNHRQAGALGGSQGPTLYALAPWEDGSPPSSGQNLDATPLLAYRENYGCVWEGEGEINRRPDPGLCDFPGYRAADSWGGGAWVEVGGRSGVLVVGRKGLGDNCYGTQADCQGDPCDVYKGYHAYPYEPQILFYDPDDLRAVIAGSVELWEVLPYAVYSPVQEVFDRECAVLGAAAYDPVRNVIYVTEQEAGPWGETAVHAWTVE